LSAEAERLAQLVELDHRGKVAAAVAADARHRPRDTWVKVRVTAPFRFRRVLGVQRKANAGSDS
jgi:hypothetical protein